MSQQNIFPKFWNILKNVIWKLDDWLGPGIGSPLGRAYSMDCQIMLGKVGQVSGWVRLNVFLLLQGPVKLTRAKIRLGKNNWIFVNHLSPQILKRIQS